MFGPGGAAEMTRAVRDALNTLALSLAEEGGIEPRQIVETVFVCNPVMHHLLLGIDPVELGGSPFALATQEALDLGWFTPEEVVTPSVIGQMTGGQDRLLRLALAHVGQLP